MRSTGRFSPEWGYLAPAPSFVRSLRVVLVATAIGAIAGAAAVLSLVDHSAAELGSTSLAARTMVSGAGIPVTVVSAKANPTVTRPQQHPPALAPAPAQAELSPPAVAAPHPSASPSAMIAKGEAPDADAMHATEDAAMSAAPEKEQARIKTVHKAKRPGRIVMRQTQQYAAHVGYSFEPSPYRSW